jgi:hypothetical protein
MPKQFGICVVAACIVLAGLLSGCKKKGVETGAAQSTQASQSAPTAPFVREKGADRRKLSNDLKQIALAYLNYWDTKQGKGPKKAEDLLPLIENDQRLLKLMQDGQIVVYWGATIQGLTARTTGGDINQLATSNTILAYERDADNQGARMVVMVDGSIQTLSQEDFNKAPRRGSSNVIGPIKCMPVTIEDWFHMLTSWR